MTSAYGRCCQKSGHDSCFAGYGVPVDRRRVQETRLTGLAYASHTGRFYTHRRSDCNAWRWSSPTMCSQESIRGLVSPQLERHKPYIKVTPDRRLKWPFDTGTCCSVLQKGCNSYTLLPRTKYTKHTRPQIYIYWYIYVCICLSISIYEYRCTFRYMSIDTSQCR